MTSSSCTPTSTSQSQPPSNHQKTINKETIHTFQKICKWIFVGTCIVFIFLFYKLFLFQVFLYGEENKFSRFYHILTYGLFFAVLYTILDFVSHHFLQGFVAKYFLNLDKYPNQQALQKRAYTIVKWGYSILYYGSCSVLNFVLLYKSTYVPEFIGGKDGYLQSEQYFFNDKQNIYPITIFYMIQFGKHFSRLLVHSFVRQEGNYYEYTLHHMLSVALIMFSYLSNLWLPGMVVLFTHDVSDAVFLVARLYNDFKHSLSLLVNFLGLLSLISWAYLRGFAFPKYLVYPVSQRFLFYLPIQNQAAQIIFWPGAYICIMLWVLLIMDYVWIYVMIKGLIAIIISPKSKSKTS